MIQFTLNLSTNQIAILRAVQAENDLKQSESEDEKEARFAMRHSISHWVSGQRYLLNEKLMKIVETPRGYTNPGGSPIIDRQQVITEKGRLVLRVIELDVQDCMDSIVSLGATSRKEIENAPQST